MGNDQDKAVPLVQSHNGLNFDSQPSEFKRWICMNPHEGQQPPCATA